MSDSFTEVTHTGWFSRIRKSIGSVIFGLLAVIISFPLLWLNEGCAVKEYKSIKEGRETVIELAQPSVNAANEGKLVHLSGQASTEETLSLPTFNINSQALKLEAQVEMYQWEEDEDTKTEKKAGGGETTTTTYTYRKVWSDRLIDSSRFKKSKGHQNPSSMPVQSKTVFAKNATVGEFTLTRELLGKIKTRRTLDAGPEVPPGLGEKAKAHNKGFYIGENPRGSAIGDVRISFYETPPVEVSIIAQQVKNTFQPYKTKTSKIQLLQEGFHTADAMFTKAENDQMLLTWGIRAGGFVLMLIGFMMILSPLVVIADFIPLIGRIIGGGTFLISAILAFALTFVTIALAWIFYRPLIGGGLLLVALLSGAAVFFLRKKTEPAASGAAGATPASASPTPQEAVEPVTEPAAPTAAGREFYLYVNEETVGPYPENDLRSYLSSGQVLPDTLCVPVGEEEWKPVSQCLGA
jgi:hypothetical protein